MLDIKYIIENQKHIEDIIQKRGMKAQLPELISLYHKRKQFKIDIEERRAKANQIAKRIPLSTAEEKPALIAQGKELNQIISKMEPQLKELDEAFHQAWLTIPNLLADGTPEGMTDAENTTLRYVGEVPLHAFKSKDHLELAAIHDWIDFDSGAKVTGSKFYFLKNSSLGSQPHIWIVLSFFTILLNM